MDGVPVAEGGVRDSGGFYSTPWPLSEKYFLVSYSYGSGKTTEPAGYGIYLVDVFGNKELRLPRPGNLLLHPHSACGRGPSRRSCPTRPIRHAARHLRAERGRGTACEGIAAGADPLPPHRGADRLALRQPARRPALRRGPPLRRTGRQEPDQLDAGPHPRRRARRARRQRALPCAGRHGGLLPVARREPHGTAAHAVVHQLPAGRSRAPASAATRRAKPLRQPLQSAALAARACAAAAAALGRPAGQLSCATSSRCSTAIACAATAG